MSIHGINQGSNPPRPEGLSGPQGAPKSEFSLRPAENDVLDYAKTMSDPPTKEQLNILKDKVHVALKDIGVGGKESHSPGASILRRLESMLSADNVDFKEVKQGLNDLSRFG